jgi:Transposase domain (DUF772)
MAEKILSATHTGADKVLPHPKDNPFHYFFLKITFCTYRADFNLDLNLNNTEAGRNAVRSGVWGRPSYPPLAMLKALLLQRWYSVSDRGWKRRCPTCCSSAGSAGRPR